jgi:hypothetical protein
MVQLLVEIVVTLYSQIGPFLRIKYVRFLRIILRMYFCQIGYHVFKVYFHFWMCVHGFGKAEAFTVDEVRDCESDRDGCIRFCVQCLCTVQIA